LDSYTSCILQNLSDRHEGRFTTFIEQLAAEQPRYFDRPSDLDEVLLRRHDDEDFPCLTELLLPVLHDHETAVGLSAFMIHHVAYACNLFRQTNYDPGEETIRAVLDWRVEHMSLMLSEPLCRMPLRARKHCATMNVRGVQELVIHRAREMLQHSAAEELNWLLYTWLVSGIHRIVAKKPRLLASMLVGYDLMPLLDPLAAPVAHFAPTVAASLCIPQELVTTWQNYDIEALEDVRFEPVGPEIDVRDVAELTATPDPFTCAICLDDFAEWGAFPDVFEVCCGHSFHAACLSAMVNGIGHNSNCCPLCRTEICDARERRRIADQVEEDETGDEDETH
jgi:hypothetical protein